MATNMNAWLKSMEDKWAESAAYVKENPGGDFQRHPDGRYTCRTTGAELTESQNGRPQVYWINTIITGDLEGESLHSYDGLDGDRSFEFLAKKLARYGYDPETFKIRQLPRILAEIAERKPVVKVRAKTNGEFQNVYLQKVMDDDYDPDEDDDAVSSRTVDEDDDDAPVARAPKRTPRAAAPAPAAPPAPVKKRRTAPVVEEPEEDDDAFDDEDEEEVAPAPVRRRAAATAPPAPAKRSRTAAVAATPAPPARPTRRPAPAAAPEPEPEEDEDDDDGEEELQVGMKVSFVRRGVETEGIVVDIDEENETATVKVGNKSYPVDVTEMEIIPEG